MGKAGDEAAAQRIADGRHHNRNGGGGAFRRDSRRRRDGDNRVGAQRHELRGKLTQSFGVLSAKSVFRLEVLALDIAQLAKARL
jgi:hypothetical protein